MNQSIVLLVYSLAVAVSSRPVTADVQVGARVSSCEIFGQSETESGISQSSSAIPCQYHSTVALHSHV
jgi:hypothetical protein